MSREARDSRHSDKHNVLRRLSESEIEAFYAGMSRLMQARTAPKQTSRVAEFRALLLKARR